MTVGGAAGPGTHAVVRPGLLQAWKGPALLVVDAAGRAGVDPRTGFFFRETRHLRTLRLRIGGADPFPASAASASPDALEFSLIHPPVETRGGGGSGSGREPTRFGILSRGLDLDLRVRVRPASFQLTLAVTSRWDARVDVTLGWELAADFAGLMDAMGDDEAAGEPVETEAMDGGLRFRCVGDGLPLATEVSATGGGRWRAVDGGLAARVRLERQRTEIVTLTVRAVDGEDGIDEAGEAAREACADDYHARLPRIEAPGDASLAAMTAAALHDLGSAALLDGAADEWMMPAAGYPLYPAAFGRDAATAAWQAAAFDRGALAEATAARLARLQGTRRDDARDEAPGRIIQQARRDPASRRGQVPFARYYGDVASPFMYVIAVGNAFGWSGERALVDRHWDAMRRVMDWARTDGDPDGDGYVEYHTRSPDGPRHQAWKDSDNAVVDERGEPVRTPFASCEIQGYRFAALQLMAGMALARGERGEARALWREASSLKRRFNRDFWIDGELGSLAFGLDADKRPIAVPTSNAGQCIATGIVADRHLPRLVDRLFRPDLFSGWGIRTLSADNPAYNPLSYHLGSVWPVENASILFGLRRYGFDAEAMRLARALYDLARLWPGARTPECVGGYPRADRAHPGAYPRANPFQSWNQSVFPMMLQALLGARAVAPLRVLAIDPVLPPWLPEVTVRDWRIGDAVVTLRFHRDEDGRTHHRVLARRGRLHVLRQPPVDSLSARPWDRVRALLRSGRRG